MASEKMSFENADRWTDAADGRRMSAYTISSPMSIQLRWAKKGSKKTKSDTYHPAPLFAQSPSIGIVMLQAVL